MTMTALIFNNNINLFKNATNGPATPVAAADLSTGSAANLLRVSGFYLGSL
jgi:hypothetical protein